MPAFATAFGRSVGVALALAQAGDRAAAKLPNDWPPTRVEFLYEVAFLRAFIEWESFLEQTFVRYLCGHSSSHGQMTCPNGYFKTIAKAEADLFGRSGYAHWYDPNRVVGRAKRYFTASTHELVISSAQSRLAQFATLRHRIAHGQEDSRKKFDVTTMALSGQRYGKGRPGKFLRDVHSTGNRWLEVVAAELGLLAQQIA